MNKNLVENQNYRLLQKIVNINSMRYPVVQTRR